MRIRAGFTLTEVLVAIVVIAVLAGLAVPNFRNTIEQARSNEAIANLNVIRMGQRIYRLNQGRFWPDPDGTNATIANINTALNVDLDTEFYTGLSVTSTGAGTAFTATASRTAPSNKTYTIDQDGNITEGGAF